MKVFNLNYSDVNGGAARAAYRIHQALLASGIDSSMIVANRSMDDWTIEESTEKLHRLKVAMRTRLVKSVVNALITSNPIAHSPAIFPSKWVKRINGSDADIVHLHWVQGEMLSIADIGQIQKPIVWTLHDMWAFCGAEHYTEEFRWREGYYKGNRPSYESGFDLNRWTWSRKRMHWQRPMHIVTPSRWLGQCVRESALMRDWPISVIPNPIDTERWQPLEQGLARELLGLPKNTPLLLFGAMGGSIDPRKGFDLLQDALQYLRCKIPELRLVIFGQLSPKNCPDLGFPVHYTGHLHDELSLRALYSAADVFALPSRQDNLPNTGIEAMACGTPVIAFDACGMRDIVTHQSTGYLAKAFDAEDLANGIIWLLAKGRQAEFRLQVRKQIIMNNSYKNIPEFYFGVYESVIKSK